jgi:two-component system, chemotaxis family, sensor kinase Cph1
MEEEQGSGDKRLRAKARKNLEEKRLVQSLSDKEASKLIEELSIHQEELKIQNEELMRVQIELEMSRAKYFQLYDLAPVGYITMNMDLIIKEANLAASMLLETNRNNMINRGISSFILDRCQETLYLHFLRVAKGEGKQKHVLIVRRKDGKKYLVQFESNLIEDGTQKGFRSILTDVTELRRAQKAQKDFSKDLERSNNELEAFAYVASHDLREPLRMVRSYLDLLERMYHGKVLDEQADMYIGFARDGADRMQVMIDDILNYARIGTQGDPYQLIDMGKVIDKVLKALDVEIKESEAVVTVGPMPKVTADPSQMMQLMQNLIANAIKFHGPSHPEIHISASQSKTEFTFAVKDNGIGIDMEYRNMIFVMFQRLNTKEKYCGSGLGLAIAKKIVERHDGRIWVESELGKGATFYFTIPKIREDEW